MLDTCVPCSAPAKVMLAGEYAVVHGGPALMLAVNRRAVASVCSEEQRLSPFLRAAKDSIAQHLGPQSVQARRAARITVDSSSFRSGSDKLGLGSSAAVTVAAIGAALGSVDDRLLIHQLAAQAHRQAQGGIGSGADIAACTYGGCLRFQTTPEGPQVSPVELPGDLRLVFVWTGKSASTPKLLGAVEAFGAAEPQSYRKLRQALSESAEALANATSATEAVQAIAAGGRAAEALGQAAGQPLWLPIHSELAAHAEKAGGALKPTGAGGGDLALAAFPTPSNARVFRRQMAELEIFCPLLGVDQGVRLDG